ncbi:MAG: glycosyltransferase family 39 protein [Victivallaceae bacterium]
MYISENVLSFVKQKKIQWLLLTMFAVIVFFVNIGSDGIYAAQESRAAIVAQNMISSGNILHVAIKGEPATEKPILCYWFYAISGRIFGVNEFSVRLPSVIAAVASVLMACWLGSRIYGAATGFISGYILASMIGFINLGRLARIDIVLCAFFTAAMLFLYTGYFEKRKANWHLYLFYITLGLSVLLKGPVTVVLAALVVLCMAFKDRNLKMLWELKPVSGFIIGSIITIPWFTYETCRTHGDFALDFFINQNIRRFTGIDMSYCDGKRKTFFYYFPKFFANALPWSLLVPFCLYIQ